MAFLIPSLVRAQASRVIPVFSTKAFMNTTRSATYLSSSSSETKQIMSRLMLTDHPLTQPLAEPSKLSQVEHLLSVTSPLRLPTLDKNLNVPIKNPIITPCMQETPLLSNILEKFDPLSTINIEEPPQQVMRKEAAHLIVIRKRKMRKQKLKKLRKKMRIQWATRRQRREYRKEKAFQAKEMAKIRRAEAFDPVKYVNSVLAKVNEQPEPLPWERKDFINVTAKNIRK